MLERYILVYPNGSFMVMDDNSGGYPYEGQEPFIFYSIKDAQNYKIICKDYNFVLKKLNYIYEVIQDV